MKRERTVMRSPTSINTSSAVSGLIKHTSTAQFSRNNNKQQRGLDVHDYFTQAHVNINKSLKAGLLLKFIGTRFLAVQLWTYNHAGLEQKVMHCLGDVSGVD